MFENFSMIYICRSIATGALFLIIFMIVYFFVFLSHWNPFIKNIYFVLYSEFLLIYRNNQKAPKFNVFEKLNIYLFKQYQKSIKIFSISTGIIYLVFLLVYYVVGSLFFIELEKNLAMAMFKVFLQIIIWLVYFLPLIFIILDPKRKNKAINKTLSFLKSFNNVEIYNNIDKYVNINIQTKQLDKHILKYILFIGNFDFKVSINLEKYEKIINDKDLLKDFLNILDWMHNESNDEFKLTNPEVLYCKCSILNNLEQK